MPRVIASALTCDTQDFLQRGVAGQHVIAAVRADAGRGRARVALEFLFGDLLMNQVAHFIVDDHQFVYAGTPAVAGVAAMFAAGWLVESWRLGRVHLEQLAFAPVGAELVPNFMSGQTL